MSKEFYPIVVAGGGHAGVEAALAISRMGAEVILVTQDPAAIARASCNPAIGGLAKGHLVKEIDALGGEMGFAADLSGIQFKVLNRSKGRAVWSPRAQIDKRRYTAHMQATLFNAENIRVHAGEVVSFCLHQNRIKSAILRDGLELKCSALIVTSGTFQNGLIHIGADTYPAGRFGEKPSHGLTEAMAELGMTVGRLKTGTPPRLLNSSIDWDKLPTAPGDRDPEPFSIRTPLPFRPRNMSCHLAYTQPSTHQILEDSLHLSAMYSGKIQGIGPRYCPSIEDKIVRFADREQHQLFLEPEWLNSKQIYVNGFSTSMPQDVQERAIRTVRGLEKAQLIRPGYAIEYDFLPPAQLKITLETKSLEGLFLAGQINGTSGYEEAAAQGLMAGINAVLKMRGVAPFTLQRDQAYIGVLMDDLVTKEILDPYRMFTARAEYRLTLRPDTADIRLTEEGYQLGTVHKNQYDRFRKRLSEIQQLKTYLQNTRFRYNDQATSKSAAEWILNPKLSISNLIDHIPDIKEYSPTAQFTAETDLKYAGYISREKLRIDQLKGQESSHIPLDFDFHKLKNLSYECREKLTHYQPETLGQASRIAGVSPADIAVLSIFLRH